MSLNWNDIRPLNGSQAKGFEELCAQLARAESPETAEFVRKGSPDAGVECYCVLGDGSEWGWQSKYFLSALTNSQRSQLDDSVKRALDKHPALTRYYVCIPHDRSDARSAGQMSELQRWQERVEKWRGWAQERCMDVEYVWWGSSELIERLSQNEHIGRRYFWFGGTGFDENWFQAHVDEAVDAAGPRYTPEVHVELEIAQDLERFGRSGLAFNEVKSLARGIRRTYDYLDLSRCHENLPDQAESIESLRGLVNEILEMLSDVEPRPAGELPFSEMLNKARSSKMQAETITDALWRRELEHTDERDEGGTASRPDRNPFSDLRDHVNRLRNQLERARTTLRRAHKLASGQLLLLRGGAGTGKTHLLCDIARTRLALGRPTVLLMGQRFLTTDPPWIQALHQLDLHGVRANEFVGALEAAAQAADCRALFVVDAVNEGQGRSIWPAHLTAFLQVLRRSPWIGVVLSVRSEYEDILLSEQVHEQAVGVTHRGFEGHEYEATRTFFEYYDLEFPATPILRPEFSNPQFLTVLCKGLQRIGERRLPPGFHGITRAFDLYFQAVNARLAEALDFNPNDQLVRKVLNALGDKLVEEIATNGRSLDRVEAEALVNEFLPGRGFERSLYRWLVVEGVLIEGVGWGGENTHSDVVYISYDRFADHIIANSLLDAQVDVADPGAAFQDGGPLAFIGDSERYVAPGLIGALCIQVPERFGHELVTLAPKLLEWWGIGDAFRQSIVWRKLDAFSDETRGVLNACLRNEHDSNDTWGTLLTIATIDGHAFNAECLDRNLIGLSMPERDAWWSTFLHWTWGTEGAVDRLVDWASGVSRETEIDARTIDLCALTLGWMLTTSNRFLRDRATKALISLLTGRLDATARLIGRFADVNDPYVAERVYAVAYGVAMRSHDSLAVGSLASLVYEQVFASGSPPVHILLRDYARGVVERAIYLNANVAVDERLIRPPYSSIWPHIASEDELRELGLTPDQMHDGDYETHPAKSAIVFSVMSHGDFAWYVIGPHSPWLSLRLDEEPWRSPDVRLTDLADTFNAEERSAWEEFRKAKEALPIRILVKSGASEEASDGNEVLEFETTHATTDGALAERDCEIALERLLATLRSETLAELNEISEQKSQDPGGHGPLFDSSVIERYVVQRVFDLGWSVESLGEFDESVRQIARSREASKAERIGKKYQWIAYHEILAYIADHHQYLGAHGYGSEAHSYE
ncbi:MAG: ATP-binding protein, partial [Chloroflexi bacterium]|nr:ATP-binding protein [Chloroflexota bacterium]